MTVHGLDPDKVTVMIGGEPVRFDAPVPVDMEVEHEPRRIGPFVFTVTFWAEHVEERDEIDVTPKQALVTDGSG